MTSNPSGSTMFKRTVPVKKQVESILEQYPQCRGDDMQLVYRFYRRYSHIRIGFDDFKALRAAIRPETISRRRREVQHDRPDLKASGRVEEKRARRESAFRHNYGVGQLTLIDMVNGE